MTIIDRRHSVSEGIAIKAPCRAATTANIALAGQQTVDGVAVAEGDRVLVKSQTDAAQNGLYEVSTGPWTRTRDFDGAFDVVKGTVVRVTDGASHVGYWEVTSANPIAIGGTPMAFAITANQVAGVSTFVHTLLGALTGTAFVQTLIDSVSLRGLLDMLTAEPAGVIHAYAGATAPTGYLLCYGQAVSRTTYAALFGAIGTTFGAGDGATTFGLPDLRGRAVAGKDNMGGTSANRLSGLSGGLDGDVLGAGGGAETHVLTLAQAPAHDHGGNTGAGTPHRHGMSDEHGTDDVGASASASGYRFGLTGNPHRTDNESAHTHPISSAGGGAAHNNVQPTIVMNYIIKI